MPKELQAKTETPRFAAEATSKEAREQVSGLPPRKTDASNINRSKKQNGLRS